MSYRGSKKSNYQPPRKFRPGFSRKLQMKKGDDWQYVFASTENQGVATTQDRKKALYGEDALGHFQGKYGDSEFRLESKGNDLQINTSELKQAIARAEKDYPKGDFWQAEMIEIVMIPSVKRAIEKLSNHKLNLKRVTTKFGKGYVLEGWNSVSDDYYSTNPSKVWDGIRRNYVGAQDTEFLRMVGSGNNYAKTQLRHFKVED